MLKTMTVRATIAAILTGLSMSAYAIADSPKTVDIPAGDLRQALLKVSEQFGADLVFSPEQIQGIKTGGAHGELTTEQAVTKLLEGTPLELRTDPSGAMLIAPPAAKEAPQASTRTERPKSFWSRLAEASSPSQGEDRGEVTTGEDRAQAAGHQDVEDPAQPQKRIELEEIVVTGTHLRGVATTGSPTVVYSRAEIDESGTGSLEEFFRHIPQNFAGTSTEMNAVAGAASAGLNESKVSGINLRGLGSNATLVLVDGRRVAPGNVKGDIVDISLIPTAAIERLEIVTDGASAVYGSDAVGGVVNFLLRKNFSGAESRLRYAQGSSASMPELRIGQTFGTSWGTGSALLSYEFYDRDALTAGERRFTRGLTGPLDLLPDLKRHGVFFGLNHQLPSELTLFANGMYSQRDTIQRTTYPGGIFDTTRPSVESYGATIGVSKSLFERFQLEISSTIGSSNTENSTFRRDAGEAEASIEADQEVDSDVRTVDVKIDGPVASLPAGPLIAAIGAQYRTEDLTSAGKLFRPSFAIDRNVTAGYLELQIPLMGRADEDSANRLDLNLAARAEDYSDFGSTTNPRAALVWSPINSLTMRGTIGRSFRAPVLADLDPVPSGAVAQRLPDPRTGQTVVALVAAGGNPDLNPEKATTWTAGFDFKPTFTPNLSISGSYYDIRFKDRITTLSEAGIATRQMLVFEDSLGPTIVRRNPPAGAAEAFAGNTTTFFDFVNCNCSNPPTFDFSQIQILLDRRAQNFSTVETSGVDLGVHLSTQFGFGTLESDMSATKILKFDTQQTPAGAPISTFNRPYTPVDLKVHLQETLDLGAFSVSLVGNYVDGYQDSRNVPTVPIASWTTFDAVLSYERVSHSSGMPDLNVVFSVNNVTDRAPPFVKNRDPLQFPSINFDGANASPVGRIVALQVSARW